MDCEMNSDQAGGDPDRTVPEKASEPPSTDRPKTGLDDPRALDILTTEHWSLLSTRSIGYQEMFGRTTIFVAIVSGTVVALALLAQATDFRREMLWFALLLLAVALFIGLGTFVRSVKINSEDARWVTGMNLLRHAYLQIVPELRPFFVTGHEPDADGRALGHGSPQRLVNLANSLTTTSSVVAALNSVLAGSLASDLGALFGAGTAVAVGIGTALSLASAALHVRYAGRFRASHVPSTDAPAR
jgi:hypothetical protein